jgi:ribosome modulation factor
MQQSLPVRRQELEEAILQGAKLAGVGVKRHGICGRAHCHEAVLEARPSDFGGWRAGQDPEDHEAPVRVGGHVCENHA